MSRLKPEQGKTYEFELSNGATRKLRFEGFGEFMKQVWRDVESDEVLHDLPVYVKHEQVD